MKRHSLPETFEGYVATFPPPIQAILKKIRLTIKKAAPQADERISYRMPAFFQGGALIYFAAFKSHVGIFPPVRGDAQLLKQLARYRGPKGNLKFPLSEPIPYSLISRIVKFRVKEQLERVSSKRKKK